MTLKQRFAESCFDDKESCDYENVNIMIIQSKEKIKTNATVHVL